MRRGRAPGGGSIEGRIERSETDTIYLKTADGQTIALGRDRIGDIDHPGNVAVLLSPLPVLGGFSVAAMEAFGSPNGSHTVGNVALVTGLVGGLALAVGGLVVWGGSRTRAANYDRTGPATAPAPGG